MVAFPSQLVATQVGDDPEDDDDDDDDYDDDDYDDDDLDDEETGSELWINSMLHSFQARTRTRDMWFL